MPAAAPRPASTLVLLRPGAQGPEVFMLQRSTRADFMAGAYVFPGGGVEEGDRDARLVARVRGLSAHAANARLGLTHDAIAFWIAAVRECFEEAGILLACEEDGSPVSHERLAALEAKRAALNSGALSFVSLVEAERLLIDAGRLAFFDHWITPASLERRFDTRFFLAVAPERHDGLHDDTETVASVWTRPQDAIARSERKEIDLVFATRAVLDALGRFATPQEAFAHASSLEEVEVNRPCIALGRKGKQLFRLGDPAYAEIRWSDPDETMQTSYDMTPDVPKRLDRFVTRIVAANPGYATGPGTNSYLVGDRELAVIDPGPALPAHVDAILSAGAGRIRWILCTHTHIDHSPAAQAIARATGAEPLGRAAPEGTSQDRSFRPRRELEHGERLALGGVRLRVLHTPGHASNHLCYLLDETRMLFTGDHVMQGSTVVISPPDGDMRAYLRSLELLLEEDIAILAPGHGYLIGGPRREVRRLIRHRGMREAKVVAALRRLGEASIEEMLPGVYDDVQPALHAMASRSLAAHLDKLVAEQRAQLRNGRYRMSGA